MPTGNLNAPCLGIGYMRQTMKAIASCLLVLLTLYSVNASARLLATVDRTTVSEFDLITLTLRSNDASVKSEPELNPLLRDFQVIDTSRSSQQSISITNGSRRIESHTDWTISLRPKREGRLVIPSLHLGSDKSNPVYINVVPPTAAAKKRSNELLFFETEVDTNSTYVQAQILYTVKLFYSDSISGNISEEPKLDEAIVEVLEKEKRYQSVVNNRRYHVLQTKYAIFPQKSGTLTIPGETFVGYKGASGFFSFSTREKVSAFSKPHQIKVRPKPASYPSATWLPAIDISVDESWSVNPPTFRVGEPINRIITISANGLPGSILPAITEMDQTLIKVYRDPAETSETPSSDGLISLKAEVMGIVPTQPGELILPEVRIHWWNTRKDSLEQAVIPARTFNIQAAVQPATIDSFEDLTQPAIPNETTDLDDGDSTFSSAFGSTFGLWFYLTLALTLLSIYLLYQTYSMKKKLGSLELAGNEFGLSPAGRDINEESLYKRFVGACHKNDPAAIQRQLYLWVKQVQPETESLSHFSKINSSEINSSEKNSDELDRQLNKLEQHLYSNKNKTSFSANDLLELIANIRQTILSRKKTTKEQLAPLNP